MNKIKKQAALRQAALTNRRNKMAAIINSFGFSNNKARLKTKSALKVLVNSAVNEVEDSGMETGRFFIHLNDGYTWINSDCTSKSFSSFSVALKELNRIVKL